MQSKLFSVWCVEHMTEKVLKKDLDRKT